jgi:hypothetical protein
MNKVILIGNGFDKAHGLPTSYREFIDAFWKEQVTNARSDFRPQSTGKRGYAYDDEFCKIEWPDYYAWGIAGPFPSTHEELKEWLEAKGGNMEFHNKFLEQISEKRNLQNWVDIEEEYYAALLNCLDGKTFLERIEYKNIKALNEQFFAIQTLLGEYLERLSTPSMIEGIGNIINANFRLKDFCTSIRQQYQYADGLSEEKERAIEHDMNEELPQICFLNLNYTTTEKLYKSSYKDIVIHIHGELNSPNNPIIFGYGDEQSEKYQEILNRKQNEYLKFFKTTKYLATMNYKRLEDFINTDTYQVLILGASCGTSDRTLLKELFEHPNCVSIKSYYYGDNEKNNYTEMIMGHHKNA